MTEQFGSVKVSLDALIMSLDDALKEVKDLAVNTNNLIIENESKISNTISAIESVVSISQLQSENINNLLLNIETLSNDLSQVEYIAISDNLLKISTELPVLQVIWKLN